MSNKKELAEDLAGALVAIFVGCITFIVIIVNIPGTKEIDGALIANVFTGGVTLFAPIAAYYLLNSWKEQKRYEITKELMIDVATILSDVYEKIEKSAILANSLKNIKDDKVILNNLINTNNLRKADDLNKIYTLINLYENITNDKELMEHKNTFDEASFDVLFFLSKLDPLYVKYMDALELQLEPIYIKTTNYKEGEKDKVENLIFNINYYLNESLPARKGNDDFTFDKNKEKFNDAYKEFIKEISKRLNP